jgi:hypothetical protein
MGRAGGVSLEKKSFQPGCKITCLQSLTNFKVEFTSLCLSQVVFEKVPGLQIFFIGSPIPLLLVDIHKNSY